MWGKHSATESIPNSPQLGVIDDQVICLLLLTVVTEQIQLQMLKYITVWNRRVLKYGILVDLLHVFLRKSIIF